LKHRPIVGTASPCRTEGRPTGHSGDRDRRIA
jgi:hypothetical protein